MPENWGPDESCMSKAPTSAIRAVHMIIRGANNWATAPPTSFLSAERCWDGVSFLTYDSRPSPGLSFRSRSSRLFNLSSLNLATSSLISLRSWTIRGWLSGFGQKCNYRGQHSSDDGDMLVERSYRRNLDDQSSTLLQSVTWCIPPSMDVNCQIKKRHTLKISRFGPAIFEMKMVNSFDDVGYVKQV